MANNKRYSGMGDKELMLYVQGGDNKAYGVIYERHRLPLTIYLANRFRDFNSDDIADLVQETFLRLYDRKGTYKPCTNASFKTWLYRIGNNVAIDVFRDSKGFISIDDGYNGNGELSVQPDQEDHVIAREVHVAIEKLPEHFRYVIELRLDGHEYKVIAEVLGVKLGTIRSRRSRAKDSLHKMLIPEMV